MTTPQFSRPCYSPTEVPSQYCQTLRTAVSALRERLHTRYELAFPGRSHLVRQLLAEAEEQAWGSGVPHLLLPDLAEARLIELTAPPALAHAA